MSVYASVFRSSGVVNTVALESELEDYLPAREALNYVPGGVQSTSGTSLIANQSATVALDDIGLFIFQYTCAASTTATNILLQSRIDGAAQYVNYKQDLPASVSGITESGLILTPFKNLSAGSHTFEVNMIVTGGGTGYIGNLFLDVITWKRRT